MDPTLHCKMMGHPLTRASTGRAAQKQTIVNIGREYRDGCAKLSETDESWTSLSISHDERIMTAIAIAEQSKGKMQRAAHECATMTERAEACFFELL